MLAQILCYKKSGIHWYHCNPTFLWKIQMYASLESPESLFATVALFKKTNVPLMIPCLKKRYGLFFWKCKHKFLNTDVPFPLKQNLWPFFFIFGTFPQNKPSCVFCLIDPTYHARSMQRMHTCAHYTYHPIIQLKFEI